MQLYPSNYLRGRSLHATDGEIGRCKDFLFDHEHWSIRYLVVDTRKWLPGRKVVISPAVVENEDLLDQDGHLRVRLSREDIKQSPSLEEHAPVSMQVEELLSTYYGWPVYWAGNDPWGESAAVPVMGPPRQVARDLPQDFSAATDERSETRLRSAHEIQNYHIEANDGALGHVEDFAFETSAWRIHFVILDTRNWIKGRKLALPPKWFARFDAVGRTARVARDRETLKRCPEVDPDHVLDSATVDQLEKALAGS